MCSGGDRRRIWCAYLWWFPLGIFGAHRYYLRKWGTAILYSLTCGILALGWLADVFFIPKMTIRANESWNEWAGASSAPDGALLEGANGVEGYSGATAGAAQGIGGMLASAGYGGPQSDYGVPSAQAKATVAARQNALAEQKGNHISYQYYGEDV